MSDCKYCGKYVKDDQDAGMSSDGSFELFHPSCEDVYFSEYAVYLELFDKEGQADFLNSGFYS
jgi:hypothetical protein